MTNAIETHYAGHRFRSRLEARWAVFFDTLSLDWEYEKEGFELPSGRYLPDFWLPDLDAWFEVKGAEPDEHEHTIAAELAVSAGKRVFIVHGDIPREADYWGPERNHITCYNTFTDEHGNTTAAGDDFYAWCVCTRCGRVGIEFDGRADRICPPDHGEVGGRGHNASDPRVLAAYTAARSARFEHGESG